MRMLGIYTASPLGLPYFRPDDPNSHDFIDLKAEPHRIMELPELRAEPELIPIIERLNTTSSVFKSTGVLAWYGSEVSDQGDVNYGSYVGFAMDAWPFADINAANDTARRFVEYSDVLPSLDNAAGQFSFVPTSWNREGRVGWSLDFWTWGFGPTREIAHEAWIPAIRRFGDFLVVMNEEWRRFLVAHPMPIVEHASPPP